MILKNYRICKEIIPCLIELYENPQLVVLTQEKFVKYEPTIDQSKIYCSPKSL